MAATNDERIVDESYKAVFVLAREQIASHVCWDEEKADSIGRKAMKNMRVQLKDDRIVTESTNGKMFFQVKERAGQHNIEHFPFEVNPSETPKTILETPQYIPGDVLDELAKSFPKRKNFNQQSWQRSAVFSYTDEEFEVGRSDKQGRATVDTWELPKDTGAFPPTEQLWAKDDPVASIRFDLPELQRALSALRSAGAECIEMHVFCEPNTKAKRAAKIFSITQYGKPTDREITAIVMPMKEQG